MNKSDIRKELGAKSVEELQDTIAYHQHKASVNQRIVAIAKLMLKNKGGSNAAAKTDGSSTDNAEPEQLSGSSDSGDSQ